MSYVPARPRAKPSPGCRECANPWTLRCRDHGLVRTWIDAGEIARYREGKRVDYAAKKRAEEEDSGER